MIIFKHKFKEIITNAQNETLQEKYTCMFTHNQHIIGSLIIYKCGLKYD